MLGWTSNSLLAMVALVACGGSPGATFQGPDSFTPNATLVIQLDLDGGLYPSFAAIVADDTDPTVTCGVAATGLPQTATVRHELSIQLTQPGPITTGTYGITEGATFYPTTDVPDGSVALVQFYGPNSGLNTNAPTASSALGTLTLTSVGSTWAGNFSATMVDTDGGTSTLTGSFDISQVCAVPLTTED